MGSLFALAPLSLALSACLLVPGDDEPPEEPTPPQGSTGSGGGGGGGTGGGGDGGTTPTPTGGTRAFVTKGLYTGALTSYADGATSGTAAADAICQIRATAAGLGGTWVAWLSSSSVDALDRVKGNGPWKLIGGDVAFNNRAQLQTEPNVPLDRDEHGDRLQYVYIWSGTRAGGQRHPDTCTNWTSESGMGRLGMADDTSFSWTDYNSSYCAGERRLLCLEQ